MKMRKNVKQATCVIKRRTSVLSAAMVLGFAACAMGETTRVDELFLSSAQTLEVNAGDTYEIGLVRGSGLLTKTGGGALKVYCVAEGGVQIAVSEGSLAFGFEQLPVAASNAWFRVDASDMSTMTVVEEGGTNFVTRWNDANGGSRYATPCTTSKDWRPNPETRRPFLRNGFQNGRAVVDFGSYLRSELKDQGRYGAAMHWSEACTAVREVFIVVSDTEDLVGLSSSLAGPFLLGHSDEYNFHRGMMYSGGTALIYEYNSHTANLRNDKWRLDGRPLSSPSGATLPSGFHVVNMRATDNVKASSFAHDREIAYGGQRLAECLVFDSELSDSDRIRIQAYLSMKWRSAPIASLSMADGTTLDLGQGTRLSIDSFSVSGTATLMRDGEVVSTLSDKNAANVLISSDAAISADGVVKGSRWAFLSDGRVSVSDSANLDAVSAAGKFIKEGSGDLVVCRAMDSQDIVVAEGNLTVSPLMSQSSFFHVDASDSSTMETVLENGTNFVTRWNDAVGGSCHADSSSYTSSWRSSPETRRPFLRVNPQNGLSIVDFGSYLTSTVSDGYGAAMDWSETCTEIREVFLVVADTEDLIGLRSKYSGKDINGPFLLGHNNGVYNFHRATIYGDGHPVFLKSNASAGLRNGVCWLDTRTVTPTSAAFPDNNLHVVNFQSMNNVAANAFARDRNLAFGGMRIAECVVFTSAADVSESERLRKQLLVKWLASNEANVFDYQYRDVTVAAGSRAAFPYAGVSASGTLSIGGTIEAVRVSANAIAVSSECAAVTGKLVLPETGTVSLSDFGAAANTTVKILSAGSVSCSGRMRGWRAVGDIAERFNVVFTAESDGLYATFKPKGMVIRVF